MITLNEKEISFATSDRRKRSKDKTFDLFFGAECSKCKNITIASFKTDKEINLWDYEETAILYTKEGQHKGNFNYYFPTTETPKGESCFESKFTKLSNGESYQTIRLKNHTLEPDRIGKDTIDKYQVGERPCVYISTISFKEDLALKTILALCQVNLAVSNNWDWSKNINTIWTDLNNTGIRKAKTYGQIPVFSVLCPKEKVTYGIHLFNVNKYAVK